MIGNFVGTDIIHLLLPDDHHPAGESLAIHLHPAVCADACRDFAPADGPAVLADHEDTGSIVALGQRLFRNDDGIGHPGQFHGGLDEHAGFEALAGIIDGHLDAGLAGGLAEDRRDADDAARKGFIGIGRRGQGHQLAGLHVGIVTLGDENDPQDGVQLDDHEQGRVGGQGLSFVHVAFGHDAFVVPAGPARRNPGVAQADVGTLQGGGEFGHLGLCHGQLRPLGQQVLAGRIEFRVGGDPAFTQRVGALELAVGDLQDAFGRGAIGLGHGQVGPGLGHGLDILVIVELGHHLPTPDGIGNVHQDTLHPAADLGRHHKFRQGLQLAAEGAPERDGSPFDGRHLHRRRPQGAGGGIGTAAVQPRGNDHPSKQRRGGEDHRQQDALGGDRFHGRYP